MINTILVIFLSILIGNFIYGFRALFLDFGNFRLFVLKMVFALVLILTFYLIFFEKSNWIKSFQIMFVLLWNFFSIKMTNEKVIRINENRKLKKNETYTH